MALESMGLPRMAGRIFGALLVADPPEQSADDLAKTLQASRGSISTNVRLLENAALIERCAKPGERRDYFRNRPNAWHEAMQKELMFLSTFRALAEKGLGLLAGADAEVRRGLEDMRAYCLFMEREFPALFKRWQEALERR